MADFQTVHITLQNFVFGPAHLLDLDLPQAWTLQRGFSHPEIHASHTRLGRSWVASGDAWYLLRHEGHPWLLEFHLQVRPNPYAPPGDAGRAQVAGHEAWWRLYTQRRGLPWNRRDTPVLEVAWYCPATERGFRLRAVGRVPRAALEELRRAWLHSHCHPPPQVGV